MRKELNTSLLVLSTLLITGIVSAATTISSNISTGGQLNVTGTTTLIGNVGIGTSSPYARFSYDTSNITNTAPSFIIGSSTKTDLMVDQGGHVSIGTTTVFNSSDILTTNGRIRILSTNNLSQLIIQSQDNTSSQISFVNAAASARGYIKYDFVTDGLTFRTAGVERTILDSAGRLGIGTTTPNSLMHVSAGTSATTTVEFGDQYATGSKTCFNVKTNTGTAASFFFNSGGIVFESNRCR